MKQELNIEIAQTGDKADIGPQYFENTVHDHKPRSRVGLDLRK